MSGVHLDTPKRSGTGSAVRPESCLDARRPLRHLRPISARQTRGWTVHVERECVWPFGVETNLQPVYVTDGRDRRPLPNMSPVYVHCISLVFTRAQEVRLSAVLTGKWRRGETWEAAGLHHPSLHGRWSATRWSGAERFILHRFGESFATRGDDVI